MKLRPQSPQTRVLFRHLRPSNHLLLGHLREDSIIGEPRPRTYQVGRLLYQQVVPTFRSNKRYNIIWYAKKLASMNTGSARPIERFFTEGLRRPGAAALCSWLGLFVRVSQFLFCLLARESSHSRILWETQRKLERKIIRPSYSFYYYYCLFLFRKVGNRLVRGSPSSSRRFHLSPIEVMFFHLVGELV